MFDNLSCPFTSTSFLTNKSAIINIKKIDHSGNGSDSIVFQKQYNDYNKDVSVIISVCMEYY